jgi:glycosyltransferase involved in cell wall biosynthesis
LTAISVIIPVWNRAHVVTRAIDSIFSQEMPDGVSLLEVIVVDDGSSDDLAGALSRYSNSVTCIRHAANAGAAAARNTGIAASRGEMIAFLDSDDMWLPGKFAAQIPFMRTGDYKATCTAYRLSHGGRPPIVSPNYPTGPLGLADLVWGCFVSPGSTLICRREVFDEIGVLETSFQRLEDWDWMLRYVGMYQLGFLSQPLAKIDVAGPSGFDQVLSSLELLHERRRSGLPSPLRRKFDAAVELERGAAHYRASQYVPTAIAVLKSLWLSGPRHPAMQHIFHNRFARG